MGGITAGLYLLGQGSQGPGFPGQGSPGQGSLASQPATQLHVGSKLNARALLPARSWLVVDFDGRLTGALPFSNAGSGCAQVPAPSRVGLAVVGPNDRASQAEPPAQEPSDGVALLLGSPEVSPEFWRCVRAEVLAAGGRVLGATEAQETLESPNGVLSHAGGRLLFASDRSLHDELVGLVRGQGESASSSAPHATLAASIPAPLGSVSANEAPLLATLELPADWLSGVGPEAQLSPLRHLTGGALRADADGGASGTLECSEPGCDELTAFLLRARSDLAASLPPALGNATVRSWTASRERHPNPGRGRIRLRWQPGEVAFADWAAAVWRLALGGSAPPTLPAPPEPPSAPPK